MNAREMLRDAASNPKAGRKFQRALRRASENPMVCPKPTTDIDLNLSNRDYAIKEQWYGPMNPDEENPEFWGKIADLWEISEDDAKASRCGNCAAFIQTPEMLACIEVNLGFDDDYPDEASDDMMMNREMTNAQADLGYCQLFGFKCAGDRVCRAWLHGGPVTGEDDGETGER